MSVLETARDGAVATVTMNRPSTKNALDRELVDALARALAQAAGDDAVRVIVLTGAGEAFCSGADLKGSMTGDDDRSWEERIDAFHALIHAVVGAPKPVIASIDGAAVGFGADLALACDLRVLSTRAYLQEIFVRIGLMPDGGGTFWMPRLVGIGRAMEYLLTGRKIDASLAAEVGLANRVVEPEELAAATRELAVSLSKGPPLAHARIKRAVRESWQGTIDQALSREKASQVELLQSQDLMEGVMAWAQKRDPEFTGR